MCGVPESCSTYCSAAYLLSGAVNYVFTFHHSRLNRFIDTLCADNERAIFDSVLRGNVDFETKPWPSISDSAKDLVRKMLTMDPNKRITAAQALGLYIYIHIIF